MNLSDEFNDAFLGEDNPNTEIVTYKSNGIESTFRALVGRRGLIKSNNKADNTKSLYDYEILISLSDVPAVTVGKDEITISTPQYGLDAVNTCVVAGIIGKTGMCWKLGLRG